VNKKYSLLELLREYAIEQLQLNGEYETLRQRHLDYYTVLAEKMEPRLSGQEQSRWIIHLISEQNNLRTALSWCLQTGKVEEGLRLAAALGTFWHWSSSHSEGWDWVSRLINHQASEQEVTLRAHSLKASISLLRQAGNNTEADRIADQALGLFRIINDKRSMAQILAEKGCNAWQRAEFMEARILCSESVLLARETGNKNDLAFALAWLGAVERDQGNFEKARVTFQESINSAREANSMLPALLSINGMGSLEFAAGNLAGATKYCQESINQGENHIPHAKPYGLMSLGRIALAKGDIAAAFGYLHTAVKAFRQGSNGDGLSWTLCQYGFIRHLQGETDEGSNLIKEGLELQVRDHRKLQIIESLERLAWIFSDNLQHTSAAMIFGATAALRKRIEAPFPKGDLPLHEPRVRAVEAVLDERVYRQAWAAGEQMSLDEAVAFALET
jgi:tetratricopeptide (TPR) repeat protein